MDWLTFSSSIVDQLISWPVAILAIVLLFRRQLKELVLTLRHASIGKDSFDFTFGEKVGRIEERVEQAQLPSVREEETTPLSRAEVTQAIEEARRQLVEVRQQAEQRGLAQKRVAEAERQVAEAERRVAKAEKQLRAAQRAEQERQRRDLLYMLADTHPPSAVQRAWQTVEQEAAHLAERAEIFPTARQKSALYIFRQLHSKGVIDSNTAAIADDLRALRNRAAHEVEPDISTEDAQEYIEVAERVAEHLRRLYPSDGGTEGYSE